MNLKILTFNWHEPYICNLSKLGFQFFVVAPEIGPGKFRQWDTNMRDLPKNCSLISADQAEDSLAHGLFDLVVANNVKDLLWVREFDIPKIMIFHCRLTTEIALSNNTVDRQDYLNQIEFLLKDVHKVFISESKRNDWGLEGKVIPHGIDLRDFNGYSGQRKAVLRVGNLLKEMGLARGYAESEKIINGFPSTTLGLNPTIPESNLSKGFGDLLNHYRECRVYLNTTVEEFEDGYNLSMLEAMATGMPVVSTANNTSPIVDGWNGFISDDMEKLREKTALLLEDQYLAGEMGKRARQTIIEKFSINVFLDNWKKAIQETIISFLKKRGVSVADLDQFEDRGKKNILLDYVSHPATTAHYMDRAFRKNHNVITCGAMINDRVIELWDLKELKWVPLPQDILRDQDAPLKQVLAKLPPKWIPDFYLWIETGIGEIPRDLKSISIPKVCYLIDTHIHLENHKKLARHFDHVFIAQKAYVDALKSAGSKNVYWLPLGCDPEIHGKATCEKKYDVGFVGSITPNHVRRKNLLDEVGKHFNLKIDRKFMDEMARVFSESKIVFNNAIAHDLNMRVFEALCSGSMLVTDSANGSGLDELFEDGRHFKIYTDDGLVETVRYYLEHPEERETIAEQGRAEVLANHTYEHRVESMISTLGNNITRKKPETMESAKKEKPTGYYHHVREDIVKLVPKDARCVLDVGCGAGETGKFIKDQSGSFVAGIELNPEAANEARKVLDDVIEGNIEEIELPYEKHSFDCIILADVLEHLVNPAIALKKVKECLKEDGKIIASIPNVQYFGLISHLADGNWTYQDEGILDKTHLRFFTFKEIEKLFKEAGLEIAEVDETLDPQYSQYENTNENTLRVGKVTINDLSPEELRRFFVFQYKIVARAKTSAENLEEISEVKDLLKTGLLSIHSENYDDAKETFEKVLRLDPDNDKALCGMGMALYQQGDKLNAKEYYVRSLTSNIDNKAALRLLMDLSYELNSFEDSEKILKKYLDLHPANLKILFGLAGILFKMNKFEDARECLDRILVFEPTNGDAIRMLDAIETSHVSG